ncbi:MAG TPA: hypothetical protein VLJ59_11645 [Mycobacteriales bacterium]|nr:hypothetical protein [Mycobacteriales bacterium]
MTGLCRAGRWLVVVVLLGGQLSGCGALSPGEGTGNCSLRADAPEDGLKVTVDDPHESHGTPGSMGGKARITCTLDVDEVVLKVQVQELVGGTWAVFAENTGDGRHVSPVKAGKQYTAQAFNPCKRGTFRTAARGSGILNGSKAASVDWKYSNTVTNPCAKP